MTTIVWDGKALSWDSQITQGDVKLVGEKGRRVWTPASGEAVVVVAGDATVLQRVAAAVERGEDPAPHVPADTTTVVLTRAGCTVYVDGTVETLTGTGSWGTGSMAAYAGLHLGQNSAQACDLACNVDLYSQGPVNTVPKSKLRARKQKARAKI